MMNDSLITDQQLDRLVDGEASDEEYRRLLESLDDEPAGWRRCALAFLEAQALRRDLTDVAMLRDGAATLRDGAAMFREGEAMFREGEAPAEPPSPKCDDPTRQQRIKIWPLALAMSACFLIAFSIGALIPGSWLGAPAGVEDSAGVAAERPAGGTPDEPDAAHDAAPINTEMADAAESRDRRPGPEFAADQAPSSENTMVIEYGDGPGLRRTEVPYYYSWDDYVAASLDSEAAFPSDDFINAVRRMGHDLRQRRQFLPVQLENGRRVLVPMDELEITPVSDRRFQ